MKEFNKTSLSPHSVNRLPLVRYCAFMSDRSDAEPRAAMTWDKDAVYKQAKAVADEFYGRGYQVVNGPSKTFSLNDLG